MAALIVVADLVKDFQLGEVPIHVLKGQTVLTAFQQVEDALASLRLLAMEAEIAQRAVTAARESLDLATIQYRGGLTSYLQVITAQTSLLQNQRAAVDVRTRQLLASVALIQALGGGWRGAQ
jgi:outer membrane protein TolC